MVGRHHKSDGAWRDSIALAPIRILFVGVAPTDIKGRYRGTHFWSHRRDLLRKGLFRVLDEVLQSRLSEASERSADEANTAFISAGFFFVHSTKIRPIGMSAPPGAAIAYCATRHLAGEIEALVPQSVCFLGKNAGLAAAAVFGADVKVVGGTLRLGKWIGRVACSYQPRRGWDRNGAAPTVIDMCINNRHHGFARIFFGYETTGKPRGAGATAAARG